MSPRGTVRLGTRGSRLALAQARSVAETLEDHRYDVELVTVETTGDQLEDALLHELGTTGAFVRDLDLRVLEGELEAAVHSLKDVPTESLEELVVAAIPPRGPPGDLLVSPAGHRLEDLPEGATVGTSSLRRGAQLQAIRPDLTIEPLRGNVDTRLAKLLAPTLQAEYERRVAAFEAENGAGEDDDGRIDNVDESNGEHAGSGPDPGAFERTPEEWLADRSELERAALDREVETAYDAIVLAEVGLRRAGLADAVPHARLPVRDAVPAPGQGALALTARDDDLARHLRDAIDDPRSRVEVTVERTVLSTLGGGCVAPIGVNAVVQGEVVQTHAQILSRDGTEVIAETRELPIETHPEAARELAADLADRGAATLIERARRDDPAADTSDPAELPGPARFSDDPTDGGED